MPEHGQVVEEAQDGAAGAELGRGSQEPPGQPRGPGQRCPRQLAAVGQRPDLQSPREGMLQPGLLTSSLFHPLIFSPLSLFLSLLLSLIHLSLFSFSSIYRTPWPCAPGLPYPFPSQARHLPAKLGLFVAPLPFVVPFHQRALTNLSGASFPLRVATAESGPVVHRPLPEGSDPSPLTARYRRAQTPFPLTASYPRAQIPFLSLTARYRRAQIPFLSPTVLYRKAQTPLLSLTARSRPRCVSSAATSPQSAPAAMATLPGVRSSEDAGHAGKEAEPSPW